MVRRMSRPPEDDYGDEDDREEQRPTRSRRSARRDEEPVRTRRSFGTGNADNMDVDYDEPDEPADPPARNRNNGRGFSHRPDGDDNDGDDYSDEAAEDEASQGGRRNETRRTRSFRSDQRSEGRGSRENRTTRSTRSRGDSDDHKQDRRALHTADMKTYKEKVAASSLKYRRFDVKEGTEYPIAFLEPEPFAHFFRHWLNKRPYTCLGDTCPLCDAGDRAKPVLMFNIYDFTDDHVKVWEMTRDPAKKVEKRYDALDKKGKKLNSPNVCFVVSKEKGSNNVIAYDVVQLPVDDFDDYGVQPLSRDELADLDSKLYDDTIVYVSSLSDLQDAVEKIED